MNDLLLLILSSPSGAGKTTLSRRLLEDFDDFTFSVSHTTRAPRNGEVDGKDYHFVSPDAFQTLIEQHSFAEWAHVHGNVYGTSVSELDRAKAEGKSGILFDVDYQGARQIRATYPEAVGIFILPPSLDELKQRLTRRGSDDAGTISRRFDKAREEIEHYPFFDYLIVNDELEQALSEIKGIIHAERRRRSRMASRAEALLRT